MHTATLTALYLASAAMAMPACSIETRSWTSEDSSLHIRGIGYQGDGFYSAIFNEAGVANVTFTPEAAFADIAGTVKDIIRPAVEERSAELTKRATTCVSRKSIDEDSLNYANQQLAKAGAAQGWHNSGHWGWWHHKGETSYFCNYQSNYLTEPLILDMHVVVSQRCGGNKAYGYDRRRGGGGANDLSVGRCWRGEHFCREGFYG